MLKEGKGIALLVLLVSAGLVMGFAQGSSATSTPAKAFGLLGEVKTINYVVRLSSNPAPPIRGLDMLEAIISDPSGKPIEGAKVSFDLNMTNMNHGKNVVMAAAKEQGQYLGEVRFMMPGPWRVIVHIEAAGRPSEDFRFEFKVNWR
ncbi:MAG: FixH family protein [Spirochaetota bacterium]